MKISKTQQLGTVENWEFIKTDIETNYNEYNKEYMENPSYPQKCSLIYSFKYLDERAQITTKALRDRAYYAIPITTRSEMETYIDDQKDHYKNMDTSEGDSIAAIYKIIGLEMDFMFSDKDFNNYKQWTKECGETIYHCYDATGDHCGSYTEKEFPIYMVELDAKDKMLAYCTFKITEILSNQVINN